MMMGPDTKPDVRAAYSRHPAYPDLIGRQLAQRLVEFVGRGARVLELDVGVSRIAAFLRAAGAQVVTINLDPQVLRRAETTSERTAMVRGDIGNLPFTIHSFDAALVVDLLQLVPDGMAVVRDVQRVLHPSTPLILGCDWRDPTTIDARIRTQWLQIVAELVPGLPAAENGITDLLAKLAQAGAQVEAEVALLEWSDQVSAATAIDAIATRQERACAWLPDVLLRQSVERLNDWMFATHIDPHATDIALREFRIVVIRWPVVEI